MINIDADAIEADWLRVAGRMRVLRITRPDASETDLRLIAEREQLAGVRPIEPSI